MVNSFNTHTHCNNGYNYTCRPLCHIAFPIGTRLPMPSSTGH